MELELNEERHPDPVWRSAYDSLVAIDDQKNSLLGMLHFIFDKRKLDTWHKKHHHNHLVFLNRVISGTPLIILEGDVGCGKTALAHSIGTPLANVLDRRVFCFETPSNIRGSGRVGEISSRITEAFSKAKGKLRGDDIGLFIIDEADDLATDREQAQAHHEDKAGLNVLIKQIDAVAKDSPNLAIILITNRLKVLDPAVVRRASQIITFGRPDKEGRKKVFRALLDGTRTSEKDLEGLAQASERADHPFCFSDLIHKVGKQALMKAVADDRPFDKAILLEMIQVVTPSPLLK
jgi:SpoVK/Ycf46/Vps4 family AAA+-type ATPase